VRRSPIRPRRRPQSEHHAPRAGAPVTPQPIHPPHGAILDVDEVAELLQLSRHTIRRAVRAPLHGGKQTWFQASATASLPRMVWRESWRSSATSSTVQNRPVRRVDRLRRDGGAGAKGRGCSLWGLLRGRIGERRTSLVTASPAVPRQSGARSSHNDHHVLGGHHGTIAFWRWTARADWS